MRPYELQGHYDLIIGRALVDREIETALLEDPVRTGLLLGLSDAEAALLAGIREKDLSSFARVLVRRLHSGVAPRNGVRQALAGGRLMRASGE